MLAGGPDGADDDPVRMVVSVHGNVQGVGFRWWTRARATELRLVGTATNKMDGRVEVVAEGSRRACHQLLAALRGPHAPGSVALVVERFETAQGDLRDFTAR
jgi:acylphosphatase